MARSSSKGPLGSFRLYTPLTDHLAAEGHDVESLLEEAGLPATVLTDPDTRVHRAPIDALWELAIEATGDPLLALRVGSAVPAKTLGLVGYLVEVSESGVDAVARAASAARYFGDDASLDLAFERGLAVLRFGNLSSYEMRPAIAEYSVALTVSMSRQLGQGTAAGPAVEARFAFDAPAHRSDYEQLLGVPVRFGDTHNGAAFPLAGFAIPNPKADPMLRDLLAQHASDLLARMPREDSFADRVRACIVDLLPSGSPGVEDIARALKMSARTVRRRLQAEETSYRDVLDDVRHTLALQQLRSGGPSIEEIAYRLGFSDASGFHKAFRRWTGESPSDYVRSR